MKNLSLFLFSAALLLSLGCNNGKKGAYTSADATPPPGTVMCTSQMPVIDGPNHFTFSVQVKADSNTKTGTYDIRAAFGFDTANGMFTMPKGLERYTLCIRKGAAPYTFIVGFTIPKDTTFYDYFQVTGKHMAIGMQYLKAYTFE